MNTRSINRRSLLLASAVAGILATGVSAAAPVVADDKVPCYGVNKCKGTGDCGGKGHSCSGQNACKGQGFIKLEKDVCLRIQGGRLTAEAK
jgi:uncharacterized membrane protein